jgi:hypothetical protein
MRVAQTAVVKVVRGKNVLARSDSLSWDGAVYVEVR